MKITHGWLKRWLDSEAPLADIVERLTMLGLEVEDVGDPAKDLAPFVVGHVVSCERHPNADRLSVCVVDVGSPGGSGQVQVVCGAPNARTGMKGVFAPSGSFIPGTGIILKASKIRGVESNGMLLSEREVGLSDEHEGIIELPDDAPIGAPYAEFAGLDDPLIDIAITPDRADCLGVRGIARDLAAAGLGTLKPLDAPATPGSFDSPIQWAIDIPDEPGACPMVVGRYFRNLRNRPSPEWLQRRLTAIGLRPISALVDITNYVTHDLGRPLHVFDADKLDCGPDGHLFMRFARAGETMLALNGRAYDLGPGMTVIADRSAVHGIGGIMGGENTGCTETTTNVFLEVALFDPVRTAATGRKLQIESDARYRFERWVDPESALWGAEVATQLVAELCGGEASHLSIAGAPPEWPREHRLRFDRVRSLAGIDVPADESVAILERLGFATRQRDAASVTVLTPTWRKDVEGEADLVEEVVRVVGYDNVAPVPMALDSALPRAAITRTQRRLGLVRRCLANRGMMEAVTFSFTAAANAARFGGGGEELHLANPIASDLDVMRPTPLPCLLDAARRNADRGQADFALFEVGPAYADDTPDGQATIAAGLRVGHTGPRHWADGHRPVDPLDAKADALAVLAACGAPVDSLQVAASAPAWYHPGRAGELRLGPAKVLARFGEVHPRILREVELKGPAQAFEVLLDAVPEGKTRRQIPLLQMSPFMPVARDFAFVVDRDVAADAVLRAARGADKALVAEVSVFDVYQGAELGADKKSVAINVVLQPTEKTLTDEEIDAVGQKVIANVAKQTGGTLRG